MAEKRLIDANALKEKKIHACTYDKENGNQSFDIVYVRHIDEAPTVDAVEVVRCEKCLYRSQYSDENGCYKCGGLQTEEGDLLLMVKPDFFCAHGKRRSYGEA